MIVSKPKWPKHGKITGPIVMIGFGSIGRGTLPLIERHFDFDRSRFTIIDPSALNKPIADSHGLKYIQVAITKDNFKEVLFPLFDGQEGTGFCINLSVDTSSKDIIQLCNDVKALYIDTVIEPWQGFYFDHQAQYNERTNYYLREELLDLRSKLGKSTTAISCCGANPGMVSWFVKKAIMNIVSDLNYPTAKPQTRSEWAKLIHDLGVKGIHIAERDTQYASTSKKIGEFVNTWSVSGFISEGFQPAELGWGTHEKWMPNNAKIHQTGSKCAIYLTQPGATTRVRTWTPTSGSQIGLLIPHNESVSISDYYTLHHEGKVIYRPTCHYAYHPCNDAILSLHELVGNAQLVAERERVLDETEIVEGIDELGVLLYGIKQNAYWFGSQLSIEETRTLAPYQNATGLQVTSAVLAGMVWALENPNEGIVEADEMDFERCLAIQLPYLGPVKGYYTNWTPLTNRPGLFKEDIDPTDPWQFKNVFVQ